MQVINFREGLNGVLKGLFRCRVIKNVATFEYNHQFSIDDCNIFLIFAQNTNPTEMAETNSFPKRKKMRLDNYDYSLHGDYFVTIVTKGRICRFGEIMDGEMVLNDAGRLVADCYKSLEKVSEDIKCLDFVVMPNHIHFILRLYSDNYSLPELVKRLKSMVTTGYIHGVRQNGWSPFNGQLWQRGYYDHIIRNERVFKYIQNYIFQNPERWHYDKINLDCSSNPDNVYQDIMQLY